MANFTNITVEKAYDPATINYAFNPQKIVATGTVDARQRREASLDDEEPARPVARIN